MDFAGPVFDLRFKTHDVACRLGRLACADAGRREDAVDAVAAEAFGDGVGLEMAEFRECVGRVGGMAVADEEEKHD